MRIMKCVSCGAYTMAKSCGKCGSEALPAKPAKYSPADRFGGYRRKLKREMKDG